MSGPGRELVVVIGVGNEFRRDDGVGLAVIEQLRGLAPAGVGLVVTDGEPTRLIEAWTGMALAVVVDAVRAEPPHPGQIHRFVVDRPGVGPGVGTARPASSHGFGLDDAIALALALDRMPGRLIVHAIEAADLTQGTGLTSAVAEAVGVAAAAILGDIGAGRGLPDRLARPTLVPAPRDSRLWPAAAVRGVLGVTGSKDVISMRALVVYESMYGNTHVVAGNIADGLRGTYEVTVVPVASVTADLIAGADLLLVGGPTHMHGLSTASSRQAARKAAAKPESGLTLDPDAGGTALRDWLSSLVGGHGLAAAFDTRLAGAPMLTGRASHGISRLLKRHGYRLIAPPESFVVTKVNTLAAGESSRARRWGEALAAAAAPAVPTAQQ